MGKKRLLLLDDEKAFHFTMKLYFEEDFDIDSAYDFTEAQRMLRQDKKNYDLLLLDLGLKGNNDEADFNAGLDTIPEVKKNFPFLPLIVITKDERRDTIIKSLQEGANDFIFKNEAIESEGVEWRKKWISKINKAISDNVAHKEIAKKENTKANTEVFLTDKSSEIFIGQTPIIEKIRRKLEFVAQDEENYTILLTGETGTGKEVAAQFFAAKSMREKMIAIQLSAVSESLMESALFGHKKGAFTGADQDRKGIVEAADKGILFFDEIGDISMDIQIKLLRFLEERKFRRAGTNDEISVDVQVIAATHRNLEKEVENGKFREDLYHRLNSVAIELPPLRERKEDILLLIGNFLRVDVTDLSTFINSDCLAFFKNYSYPGNVRELKKIIKDAELNKRFEGKEKIDLECLPRKLTKSKIIETSTSDVIETSSEVLSHKEKLAWQELQMIEKTFTSSFNKKGIVADILGEDTDSLRYKIHTYYKKYPNFFTKLPNIAKAYKFLNA